MPKFHDPAPYDIDEHTGFKQIFDGKSFDGWDADPSISPAPRAMFPANQKFAPYASAAGSRGAQQRHSNITP
jgi:hypothetical protein